MDHNQVSLGRHNQRCKMLYSTKIKIQILYEMFFNLGQKWWRRNHPNAFIIIYGHLIKKTIWLKLNIIFETKTNDHWLPKGKNQNERWLWMY